MVPFASWIGEFHANNPEMSKLLHKAIREKSDNAYTIYQQHLASRPVNVSGAYRHLAGGQPVEFFVITFGLPYLLRCRFFEIL